MERNLLYDFPYHIDLRRCSKQLYISNSGLDFIGNQIQLSMFNSFRKCTIRANAIADQLIAPPVIPIALCSEIMHDIPTDNCNNNCRNERKKKLKIHYLGGSIYMSIIWNRTLDE